MPFDNLKVDKRQAADCKREIYLDPKTCFLTPTSALIRVSKSFPFR